MAFRILIGADLVPTKSNYELFIKGDSKELIGIELETIIKKADFTVFNLEVPLTDTKAPISKCGPALIAPTTCINGIKKINRYFFTLANNHIMDQAEQGLQSTLDIFRKKGIGFAGAGKCLEDAKRPYIIERDSMRIGIYCCAEHEFSIASLDQAGANPFDPLESLDHIESLKKQCDFIIVLYHGGKEHYRYPSPYLQKVCSKIVDKGADVVVCQHSHCIGCKENWNNGTIVYGQGNFLFDNLDNELWKTSLLIDLKIEENATYQIEYIPILKKKNGVIMAEGEKKEEILQDFFSRSRNAKNEEFISHEFEKFASDRLDNYLSILQGNMFKKFSFKVCNHLFHKKLRKWILNRIYREEEFLQIINYFECEPHRELIIQGAKNRVRDRKKKQEQKTF